MEPSFQYLCSGYTIWPVLGQFLIQTSLNSVLLGLKRLFNFMVKEKLDFGEEIKNKQGIGKLSHFCEFERVFIKQQLQDKHCLTIWLPLWYRTKRELLISVRALAQRFNYK